MTDPRTSHHQLDDLRREWRMLASTSAAAAAARLLAEREPSLARLRLQDLAHLVDLLEPGGGLSQLERAEIVAMLLEHSGADQLLRRALLQTMLPGVVAVARRLDWGRGRSEGPTVFLADLITATYELIVEWGGQRRPYAAPDLLNAVRCRMRRRLEAEQAAVLTPIDELVAADALPGIIDQDPTETLASLLRDRRNELDPVGAAALYGREVLGLSYRELSSMTGVSARRLAESGRAVARRIFA
jgi:hypothetical protein